MSVQVFAAELGAEELATLIAQLRPAAPYAILESPARVDFPPPSESVLPAEWPVGRVFGKTLELYWRQEGATYQVRLTYARKTTPPAGFVPVLSFAGTPTKAYYYLWGEGDVAIGGRLGYAAAIPGPGRAQLQVLECRDEAGRLVFYRYAALRREGAHDQ